MMRRVLPLLASGLASIAVCYAPAVGATTVRSIPAITLDLSNRTTSGVLPFDIPFVFTGTVPSTIQRVEAEFETVQATELPRKPVPCDQKFKEPLVWERNTLSTTSNTSVPIHLVVPALEAKQYYVFNFLVTSTPSSADMAAFKRRAGTILSSQFQAVEPQTMREWYPAARKELISELQIAAGKCATIVSRSGVLSPNVDYDEISPAFRLLIGQGAANQSKVKHTLGSYGSAIPYFHGRLLEALPAAAKVIYSDDVSAAMREEHETVVSFVDLNAIEINHVALGSDPDDPRQRDDLVEPIAVGELDVRIAGYEDTAKRIGDLRRWISHLEETIEELVKAKVLSREERKDLLDPDGALAEAEAGAIELLARLETLEKRITERDAQLIAIVDALELEALSSVSVTTSSLGTYDTFANYHVAADAGFLYGVNMDTSVPYVGANFYFRPVNRDVPLSQKDSFGRRFSVNLGVTDSVALQNRRSDLFGDQSIVVGVGYRLTDIFRFGAGGVVFKKHDPNPLVSGTDLAISPYLALSFDFSLAKTFKGIGGLF